MGLVLKNIKNSFSAYRGIYMLLITTQLIAVIIMFFVYGTVVSYDIAKKDSLYENKDMGARFIEPVSTVELAEVLPEVLDEIEDRLGFLYLEAKHEDMEDIIHVREEYHNGNFTISERFYEGRLESGRLFSVAELNEGSKVMLSYNRGKVGESFYIAGEEYKIVGNVKNFPADDYYILIPLKSVSEGFTSKHISFWFDKRPTQSDYDVFVSVFKEHYGSNIEFGRFEPLNVDDIIAYNSIIVLALAIGVVAALDTILVYNYITKKRKKQMAIFGINGANRIQQIFINEMEVVLITLFTAVVGVVVFRFFIEKILMEVYEIGISIFSIKAYGVMLLAYAGCIILGTLVMTVIGTRQKALEMRRG